MSSLRLRPAGKGWEHDLFDMRALCDEGVLTRLIDIAWRHQFDSERYAFKREIRELQEYVVRRYKEALMRTHDA